MGKIDFNFFVKELTKLNEARTPTTLGGNAEINNAYIFLRKYLKQKGFTSSSSIDVMAYRYIYELLIDFMDEGEVARFKSLSKEDLRRFIVPKFKEFVESGKIPPSEVVNRFTNTEKIDDFITFARANAGNRARASKKEKEENISTPLEKYHELEAKLAPYISKINDMVKRGDKIKTSEVVSMKGLPADFYRENPNIAEHLKSFLEDLIQTEIMDRKRGEEANLNIAMLNAVKNKFVEARIAANKPVTMNTFNQYILKMLETGAIANDRSLSHTLNTLQDEYNAEYEMRKNLDDPTSQKDKMYNAALSRSDRENAFKRIVDSVIPDEESRKDYFDYISLKKRLERGGSGGADISDVDKGIEQFWSDRGKTAETSDDINRKKKMLLRSMDNIEKQLSDKTISPETRRNLEKDYMKKLEQEKKLYESSEPDPTFGYMEEQVKHDEKFKKETPVFTERKFRKFVNYNHWLTMNSD